MKKNDAVKRSQHEMIRNKAGIFDFTHGRILVSGADACLFLDEMNTNYISKMKPGRAIYSAMLDETGFYIDDVIIYCLDSNNFYVVTARPDMLIQWMQDHAGSKAVTFENLSPGYVMWSVQGPKSRDIVQAVFDKDITDVPFFGFMLNTFEDLELFVSRTGFSGELGYEIFVKETDLPRLVEALEKAGKPFGAEVLPKEACLESIPGEKGLLRLRDFAGTNPLELDMEWMVRWDKEFFGKEALQKIKEAGAARQLKGFICANDEVDIANDAPVKYNGAVVGKVTSPNYGYSIEKSYGYCLIDSKCAANGTTVMVEADGQELEITLVDRKKFFDI